MVSDFDIIFCCETWQKLKLKLNSSKRGHGGICLFIRQALSKGITILEKGSRGFIWVKLCKNYFGLDSDICICFSYIPQKNLCIFKMLMLITLMY